MAPEKPGNAPFSLSLSDACLISDYFGPRKVDPQAEEIKRVYQLIDLAGEAGIYPSALQFIADQTIEKSMESGMSVQMAGE